MPVRKLWLASAPNAWIPLPSRFVMRGTWHGAAAGCVAILLAFTVTTLLLRGQFGELSTWVGLAIYGTIYGSAIGFLAGVGWRSFALVVGPGLYAWLPIAQAPSPNWSVAVWIVAGVMTSAWVFLATRTRVPDLGLPA